MWTHLQTHTHERTGCSKGVQIIRACSRNVNNFYKQNPDNRYNNAMSASREIGPGRSVDKGARALREYVLQNKANDYFIDQQIEKTFCD